jgi:hypothetical protein
MLKARGTRILSQDGQSRPPAVTINISDKGEVRRRDNKQLAANAEQRRAAREQHLKAEQVEAVIREESAKLRADRTAAEAQRVAVAKIERAKALKANVKSEVIHEGGRSRTVHKVKTTAQKLMESGKLSKDLKNQLDAFSMVVARALGAAVDDGEDSTSRLTAQYEGMSGGAFGSKTLSDKVIDARTELREIGRLIPPEMQEVFVQVVGEEVGSLIGKPKTLDQLGEMRGYLHKQASASGGTQVYDVVALIAHLAKMRGTLGKAQIEGVRRNVSMFPKLVVEQGELRRDVREMRQDVA